MFENTYFGKKDKNNEKIYEGDTLRYQMANSRDESMYIGKVSFSITKAAFLVGGYFSFSQIYFSNLEIIKKGKR